MALLVGKEITAEERDIRKQYMAALIEHGFNLLFVVIVLGYIFIVVYAFTTFDKWVALGGVAFVSLYIVLMLQMIPDLKGVYLEALDTNVAGKVPAGKISDVPPLDCNVSGKVPAGKM